MLSTDGMQPLHLRVSEADLEDLLEQITADVSTRGRDRDRAGRWYRLGQGPPRSYVFELVRYWVRGYDWRRLETERNYHGQALTWNVADPGGHFPVLEVPSSFVCELQRALRPMKL